MIIAALSTILPVYTYRAHTICKNGGKIDLMQFELLGLADALNCAKITAIGLTLLSVNPLQNPLEKILSDLPSVTVIVAGASVTTLLSYISRKLDSEKTLADIKNR